MIDWAKEKRLSEEIFSCPVFSTKGRVHSMHEQYYISKGPKANIGDVCAVGENKVLCEVISVEKGDNYLLPFIQGLKVSPGDWVEVKSQKVEIPCLDKILGKVINGLGEVINDSSDFPKEEISLDSPPLNSLNRKPIDSPFVTGVKAIDGLLTIGTGQKIGIFAGSGVGKSTLLGMLAKNAEADINVIALVGERGREVGDFIRKELGEEGIKKSVVVVATSDDSHLLQLRVAKLATSIAEKFRDKGKNVLLMMDSVTRFAEARRSVDIAAKEYPIGGKTLLMESYMKKLLERVGKTDIGSITGIYTVLVDGDDFNSPISDLVRGILDGHIILTRQLATLNHYPAISVLDSVSRVMEDVVTKEHWKTANRIRAAMSLYKQNETFFKLGTIVESEDTKDIFDAKDKIGLINSVLKQARTDFYDFNDTLKEFEEVVN